MKSEKILRNAARCKLCNDIVESQHRHDFKYCKCRAIAVDGGKSYIKRVGSFAAIEELNQVIEIDICDDCGFEIMPDSESQPHDPDCSYCSRTS